MDVSEAFLPQVERHGRLSIASGPAPIAFDSQGDLLPF
jgi:hypothetical protein